jgi:tRNA (cmo5U34)-methyltransferase
MVNSITGNKQVHGVTEAGNYDHLIRYIVPGHPLLISSILDYIPDNPGRILELGCGTGIITEMILEKFPDAKITGIDISQEMLRVASEKPALRNVMFINGDLRGPWPDGPYDTVVSVLCLHHVSAAERAAVAKRVYEVLSPGGRFVCGDVFVGRSEWEEQLFTARWLRGMKDAGMPDDVVAGMDAARNERRPELRPVPWFCSVLENAGFERVTVPFTAGFVGQVVGFVSE